MKFLWFVFVCGSWMLCTVDSTATAGTADWLIRFGKESKIFELNEDALLKLSRLKAPIRVVSAVGDARIGKSTTMNIVLHKWKADGSSAESIEEVFESGDTALPVTRGIWMLIFQNNKKENTVLLDVEGTNIGNDAITDHLSIFTTMMSSCIGVFCSQTVKNNILDFMYRLPRLSEDVFNGKDQTKNFGHLHIVIREPLIPPEGMSLESHVKDLITKPSGDDKGTDEKRKLIATYFHREHITVSEIPFVPQCGRSFFKNSDQIKKHVKYWDAIKLLSQRFENCAAKTTLLGGLVDGSILAELAKSLVETINEDTWLAFGDTYLIVEKTLCDRSYDALIAPVMALKKSTEVEEKKALRLEAFKDRCALTEQVTKAHNGLMQLIKRQQVAEESERLRLEAEKQREEAKRKQRKADMERVEAEKQKEEAERKRREAERERVEAEREREEAERKQREADMERVEAEKQKEEAKRKQREAERERVEAEREREEAERKQREEWRKREEAEREREVAVREREEANRRGEEEKRKRQEAELALSRKQHDDGGSGIDDVIKVVGAVMLLGGIFSDSKLKHNITTLNPSKYEVLGLREVAWVWNEDAEGLGLTGEARGVIAQEVEQLYPWAVVTGHDGYKRVHYAALDFLLLPVDPEQKLHSKH